MHGEDDHFGIRPARPDLPNGIQSVQQRHGDVGHNHIRPKLLRRIDECTPVVHDTNEFKTLLEESLKTLCNHHMVVREENSRPGHTRHPMVVIIIARHGYSKMQTL
jgi:hypothetical protein